MIVASSVNAIPVRMPDNADATMGRPLSGAIEEKWGMVTKNHLLIKLMCTFQQRVMTGAYTMADNKL